MGNTLLSIDWDYFIATKNRQYLSLAENKSTAEDLWYQRYLQLQAIGKNIEQLYYLSPEVKDFWHQIKDIFSISAQTKVFVSDTHTLSYFIAKHYRCTTVYLFDAHADLGYSGAKSFDLGINCGNWLGMLFKDKLITTANIIYSQYTWEQPEYFAAFNAEYAIKYPTITELNNLKPKPHITAIHICRSGAWTPPWYDYDFQKFVASLNLPYQTIKCPLRRWDPATLSFADRVNIMLGI